jgi:hypothetical protein
MEDKLKRLEIFEISGETATERLIIVALQRWQSLTANELQVIVGGRGDYTLRVLKTMAERNLITRTNDGREIFRVTGGAK